MKRAWLGTSVSVLVTGLSIITMSIFGVGAIAEVAIGANALPCHVVPGVPQPFEGNWHLAYEGASHAPYKTTPPTSGPHSRRVVVPGVYREPISEELQIHILEHGHVLVQYAPTMAAADIEALERVGRRYPRETVVAPYPALKQGIALTGWQRLLTLDKLDGVIVADFIEKVSGRYNHSWQNGATDCLSP